MPSSTWDDICTTVDSFAKKINREAERLTDAAALKLKLSAKRAELEDEYGKLGKLVYEAQCPTSDEQDESKNAQTVADVTARITALREEIAALETK